MKKSSPEEVKNFTYSKKCWLCDRSLFEVDSNKAITVPEREVNVEQHILVAKYLRKKNFHVLYQPLRDL